MSVGHVSQREPGTKGSAPQGAQLLQVLPPEVPQAFAKQKRSFKQTPPHPPPQLHA